MSSILRVRPVLGLCKIRAYCTPGIPKEPNQNENKSFKNIEVSYKLKEKFDGVESRVDKLIDEVRKTREDMKQEIHDVTLNMSRIFTVINTVAATVLGLVAYALKDAFTDLIKTSKKIDDEEPDF